MRDACGHIERVKWSIRTIEGKEREVGEKFK